MPAAITARAFRVSGGDPMRAAHGTADVDRELAELNRRHSDALTELAELLLRIAAIEYRQDVLLSRRFEMTADR